VVADNKFKHYGDSSLTIDHGNVYKNHLMDEYAMSRR